MPMSVSGNDDTNKKTCLSVMNVGMSVHAARIMLLFCPFGSTLFSVRKQQSIDLPAQDLAWQSV